MKSGYELVAVPFFQCLITGGFSGLLALAAAILAKWPDPTTPALFVFAFISLFSWLAFRGRATRAHELIKGVDLETPPTQPETNSLTLRVNVIAPTEGEFLDVPDGRERLIKLAAGLVAGKPFTVRGWTGAGGLYSEAEFSRLQAELIHFGYARWRSHDPRSGVEITAKGRAILSQLAREGNHSPTGNDLPGFLQNRRETILHTHPTQEGENHVLRD